VGLNLQAANTIINVDLPWNPAVLEQRIARAHRMGQKRAVCVYVLVTEQTLEENLLSTLSSKRDLAMAALDPDSQVAGRGRSHASGRHQGEARGAPRREARGAVDETVKEGASMAAATDRLAEAGGSAFLRVALDVLGEVADRHGSETRPGIADVFRAGLDAKVVADEKGLRRLSIAMPSREKLAALMQGIAGLLAGAT
jgi:transketolase C-terminal domain/subunit